MRLKGKVAIVTGAGGGIGSATALRFAQEGAKVVVNDVRRESAEKVVAQIKAAQGEAMADATSISDKAAVDKMVATTIQTFGHIDILINNAGINKDAFAKKMTLDQWNDVLQVNLTGTFICCQAVIPHMSERNSGRIVNTSSIAALGNLGQANYSASKAAIIGLTRTLALELARNKVTVNCIAPGPIMTPMLAGVPAEVQEKIKSKIPLNRFGLPEEVAALHLFLASEEAAFITGQAIFIDGGMGVG